MNEFEDSDFTDEERRPFAKDESPEAVLRRKAEALDLAKLTRQVLESRVAAKVDELIAGRIEQELEAIFAEGWVATNQWGEPERGDKKVGIRERIATYLSGQDGNYDRDTRWMRMVSSKIERKVEVVIDEHVKEFRKELKAFKQQKMHDKLRAVLDGDIFR